MIEIQFRQEAIDDIWSIYNYIARDSINSAAKILNRIYKTCLTIQLFPEAGRKSRVADIYEFVIPTTRYILVYKVVNSRIEVIAVLHSSKKR